MQSLLKKREYKFQELTKYERFNERMTNNLTQEASAKALYQEHCLRAGMKGCGLYFDRVIKK
jgi:hypothetical protein